MLRLFLVFSLLCTTAWTMIIFFPPPLYVKLNPGTKPYTGRVSSDCGGVSKQLLPNDLINIANKSIFLAIPWELAQDPPLSIVLGTNYGNFFLVILLLLGEGWPSLFTLIFLILLSLNASVCECQYNIGQFLFWLNWIRELLPLTLSVPCNSGEASFQGWKKEAEHERELCLWLFISPSNSVAQREREREREHREDFQDGSYGCLKQSQHVLKRSDIERLASSPSFGVIQIGKVRGTRIA